VIIPVRMPDGIPDYSRLADWTAVCDTCPARIPLGEVTDWLIPRTQDGRIYCPPCAHRAAEQLIAAVFPTGTQRPARTGTPRLRSILRRLLRSLRPRPHSGKDMP
jgi:hypothetical protein